MAPGYVFEPNLTELGCRGLALVRQLEVYIFKPLDSWRDDRTELLVLFQPLVAAAGLRLVPEPKEDEDEEEQEERLAEKPLGHLHRGYEDECTSYNSLGFIKPMPDAAMP